MVVGERVEKWELEYFIRVQKNNTYFSLNYTLFAFLFFYLNLVIDPIIICTRIDTLQQY